MSFEKLPRDYFLRTGWEIAAERRTSVSESSY